MPVELNIVESVTELDTTVVTVILESASEPGPAGPGVPTGGTAGQVLTKDSGTDYDTSWQDATGGGGGGVTDADYLVGTAHAGLSAEIVVGTSPGGELGGTWASPTVATTHSGSSHAAVQAAAEATAAAALSAHLTDTTDAHDASAISSAAAGNLAATDVQAALNELDTEKAAATHAHAGEDITSGTVADARIASTIARDSEVTSAISALSTVYQPLDSDLTAIAALTTTSFGRAFLAFADEAAFKAGVNLEAGTDFPSLTTFNDHSARHENGGADEISLAGLDGTPTDLQAHLDDTTAAHAASAISFSPDGSIAATTVQAAIVEVRDEAGGSSAVSFIPTFFAGGN